MIGRKFRGLLNSFIYEVIEYNITKKWYKCKYNDGEQDYYCYLTRKELSDKKYFEEVYHEATKKPRNHIKSIHDQINILNEMNSPDFCMHNEFKRLDLFSTSVEVCSNCGKTKDEI